MANSGLNIMIINRLDYYGNSVQLGAFCNALTFILYGFQRANVFKSKDSFLWGIILLYGGLGQATSGLLEFIKGRTFLYVINILWILLSITFWILFFAIII